MEDFFKIYIEQLRQGQEVAVSQLVAPDFLEIEEEELLFDQPIDISLKASIAEHHLLLQMSAKTCCKMPCSICNQMTSVELAVRNHYFEAALDEVKTGIFDSAPFVREAILLEVPLFAECQGGVCPARSEIAKYLKKGEEGPEDPQHHPFANLL